MKPASLLRWYPRAWRERYGGELVALIQDDLDEGQPAWRLRLSAMGGGLRERGRQARRAAAASVRRPGGHDRWGTILMAGLVGRRERPWRPGAGWSSSRALTGLRS